MRGEFTVAIARSAGEVLIRGPGGQRLLGLTTPERRLRHDVIRVGEYQNTA